jgi:hypothetical protein
MVAPRSRQRVAALQRGVRSSLFSPIRVAQYGERRSDPQVENEGPTPGGTQRTAARGRIFAFLPDTRGAVRRTKVRPPSGKRRSDPSRNATHCSRGRIFAFLPDTRGPVRKKKVRPRGGKRRSDPGGPPRGPASTRRASCVASSVQSEKLFTTVRGFVLASRDSGKGVPHQCPESCPPHGCSC